MHRLAEGEVSRALTLQRKVLFCGKLADEELKGLVMSSQLTVNRRQHGARR